VREPREDSAGRYGEPANGATTGTARHPGPAPSGPGAAEARGKPISACHPFLRSIAMPYRTCTPAPPLGDFVDSFWHYDGYAPPHLKERILPSGTVELVINHRDDEVRIYNPSQPEHCKRFSGALVSGAYRGSFVIDSEQQASIMGVHFRPGGAFPFLGLPAGELLDAHVDLETLWGPSAVELRERLCAAATPEERFRLLEAALAAHLFRPLEHHGAVSMALAAFGRTDGGARVRDVARRVGLSERRFIQVFTAEVGLTPKLFCRVQRFQRARARVRRATAPDWARLAAACGYFDQSHLIRDFRAFSGLSPTDYLRRQNEADDLRRRGEHVSDNHLPQSERGQFRPIRSARAAAE
jgi:AraC-like DNA-binding protein